MHQKVISKAFKEPTWFIEQFTNTNSFECNKELTNTININKNTICLHSRTLGITNTVLATILWHMVFRNDITILLGDITQRDTRELMSRLYRMYDDLPEFMKPGLLVRRKYELVLYNNVRVMAKPSNNLICGSRGTNFSIAFFSGFAQYNDQEHILATILPCMDARQKLILTSNSVHARTEFNHLHNAANLQLNDFVPLTYDWTANPSNDGTFEKHHKTLMGKDHFDVVFNNHKT